MQILIPSANMHFKSKITGDIYEGNIYLGIYDSADNYIEVTEEEYQEWLNRDLTDQEQLNEEEIYE